MTSSLEKLGEALAEKKRLRVRLAKCCKNCFLPETYPDIIINKDGICNYCLEGREIVSEKSNERVSEQKKMELKKKFEKFVKNCKGKREYDCLLLLSGGKDSSYLFYLLKEKYGLNVLALTIDTGMERIASKLNIEKIVKHYNADHIFFTPEDDFYKRFYRYYLTHPDKNPYCDRICKLCSCIMHSIALNIATEKKIPFVALGYSPDQASCYEFSKEILSKSWVPKELYNEPFTEKDRSYFWDPENVNEEDIPRFILPFYAIEYPSAEKIIKELSERGLGSKKKLDPLKSNCYLAWLLMYLDYKKHGYNPYIANCSSLIRSGKIKQRKKWFLILTAGVWLFRHGFVKRKHIKHALNYLGLKLKNLI